MNGMKMKRSGRAAWRLSFLVLCVLALIPRSPLTRAYGGETLSPIADNAAWDDYYVGGEGALVTNDYVTPANSVRITTLERYNYNGLSKELFSAPLNLSGKSLISFSNPPTGARWPEPTSFSEATATP
jgi:hypothetical protein